MQILLKLNSRKANSPVWKWANDLNRHLMKEDIQIANKHLKDTQHVLQFMGSQRVRHDWATELTDWLTIWYIIRETQTETIKN